MEFSKILPIVVAVLYLVSAFLEIKNAKDVRSFSVTARACSLLIKVRKVYLKKRKRYWWGGVAPRKFFY